MGDSNKKCSFEDHKEIDANFYCFQCGINFCNKCNNIHSKFFKTHKIFSLDNNFDEIFTGFCKEKNHNKYDLSFYCKNHNKLCCYACISRIKTKEAGNHKDCDVCLIEDIKEEKINNLNKNIKSLEELSNNINISFNNLKQVFDKMNTAKENLKLKIQKIFTGIRNELNNREDELLIKVDKQYENLFFKHEFIKETEKLPKKLKVYLEKGKQIKENKDKNNENNINSLINDCINIENIMEEINKINVSIKKCEESANTSIVLNIDDEKEIKEYIKSLGKIEIENNSEINYDLYNNFNIQLKNPIHHLKYHTGNIYCLTILKDGRLVSGSGDSYIIVYNKLTYQRDIIIKEHKGDVNCIITLSSGELVSCSADKEIKIFTIENNKYKILQTLKNHTHTVYKIVQLKNKNLVSCSADSSIIFYNKNNLGFISNFKIETNGGCYFVIQTKDNELCYSEDKNSSICFYDLIENKLKSSLSNISKKHNQRACIIKISKELILIPGYNKLSIINTNNYQLVRIIEVLASNWFCGVCLLNKNMILTADYSEIISQWKIEGDNLNLVSKKEKAHEQDIVILLNLGNGLIASGSEDHSVKIW